MPRGIKKRMVIVGRRGHGVGYRPLLLSIAESLEVGRFFAGNLFIDGVQAVEVLVEDEEEKVNAFLDVATKRRPEGADVEGVDVSDYDGVVMKTESYYRYLTSMQLTDMVTYGRGMMERQEETVEGLRGLREEFKDYRNEFRDYRGEFRGFAGRTDENFRLISEKYGEISEGLRAVLEALIRESGETRERLAEAMEMLAEAIRLLRES